MKKPWMNELMWVGREISVVVVVGRGCMYNVLWYEICVDQNPRKEYIQKNYIYIYIKVYKKMAFGVKEKLLGE